MAAAAIAGACDSVSHKWNVYMLGYDSPEDIRSPGDIVRDGLATGKFVRESGVSLSGTILVTALAISIGVYEELPATATAVAFRYFDYLDPCLTTGMISYEIIDVPSRVPSIWVSGLLDFTSLGLQESDWLLFRNRVLSQDYLMPSRASR
ncbi:MAG: hypothetical protein JSR77_06600 [Planctomycetes bacterium]|nr:hypothetical protein [Planctomycetota bacterium]